jgi:ketosteroid isomerase-like protein
VDDARLRWREWLEPWHTYETHIERIVPIDERVLVLSRTKGRMEGVEHELELFGGSIYFLRDGRVARVEHYANSAEALEAVGLRE